MYELTSLPQVLTVADVARYLRIGKNQAYRLVAIEGLGIRVGGTWRVPRQRLATWLENGTEKVLSRTRV